MSKINIPPIAGGYNLSKINNAFQTIEDHLNDKVLYRDVPAGEPNQMENDLDMNGNRIYNLPEPVLDHEPARKQDVDFINEAIGSKKTVRVSDVDIPPLPSAFERRNKLLTFDIDGNPQVQFPAEDSSTQLRMDLAAPTGSGIVSFTQSGAGAATQTLEQKVRRVQVSPMDFGAVGDGVADDTIAVQHALSSSAQVVTLDDGYRFRVSSMVTSSKDDRTIKGGGWLVCGVAEMEVLEIRGANTTVSVNIDGEDKARTGVKIPAGYGGDYEIAGCHIRNLRSEIQQAFGIVSWSRAQGTIHDNTVEDVLSVGDGGGGTGVSNGLARGIQLVPDGPINGSVEITRNIIRRIYGEEGDAISVQIGDVAPFPASKVYVAHNIIENFSRRAIKVQCSGAVLLGNFCVSDDAIAHARTSNAISIIASDNCSVTENELRLNLKFVGILVSGDGAGRNIVGNSVNGNRIYAPRDIGISVTLADGTDVGTNKVRGVNITPITVVDAPATTIIANVLTVPVTSGTAEQIVVANSPRSVVSENVINAETIYRGIRLTSTHSVASGNKILSEVTSAAIVGPGSGSLALVEGSAIVNNYVRNGTAPLFLNFGPSTTLRIALNQMLGTGSSDTGLNATLIGSISIPSTAYATQTFARGTIAISTVAASGQPIGWICTAAGTPGTWTTLPNAS